MGCGNSVQKTGVTAPTLLTSKRADTKANKHPCPDLTKFPLGMVLPPTDSLEVMDMLTETANVGGCSAYTSSFTAPDDEALPQRPPLESSGHYPSTFASRCQSEGWEGQASVPATEPATESFASGYSMGTDYSATTNFSFGPRSATPTRSPTPTGSLGNSRLFTLQEDASSAENPARLEDVDEDSLAPVARAVEKTVHALVDASEDAWTHAQAAWKNRWSLPGLDEEDADIQESNFASRRRRGPACGLPWTCGGSL